MMLKIPSETFLWITQYQSRARVPMTISCLWAIGYFGVADLEAFAVVLQWRTNHQLKANNFLFDFVRQMRLLSDEQKSTKCTLLVTIFFKKLSSLDSNNRKKKDLFVCMFLCVWVSISLHLLVMSHLLIRSLVRSHHSLTRSLRSRAAAFVRWLARSLTRPRALGTMEYFCPIFNLSWITVEWQWNWRIEYWAIHSSARLFTRTAAALIRSFACSPIHSLLSSWEKGFCLWFECVDFMQFQPTVGRAFVCVCQCVYVSMRVRMRVCMHVFLLHFVAIVQVGKKQFREWKKRVRDGWTNGQTDGPMDRWMDGRTDGQTDWLTDGLIDQPTDERTDQPTDGRTDPLIEMQGRI